MIDVIDNNLDAPGFSIRTAYYMACVSNFAYEDNVGGWAGRLGLSKNITFFTCGQFHGFVGILKNNVLLAFRGTQTVSNCLTDVEATLIPRPPYPGRVHNGFAKAVDEVLPEVRRLLPSPSQTKSLWLTGHSLGGAMATLASVRLAKAGYAIRAVYTYGSPRVGDRLFRKLYHLPNYRFVCGNDLVPHLPFYWCYKHVGHPKVMDHQGNLAGDVAAWHVKKRTHARHAKHIQRRHRHKTEIHDDCDFDWLADHRLDRYLEAINKVLLHTSSLRRLDQPSDQLHRIPTYVHRLGLSSTGRSLYVSKHDQHREFTISEDDFIEAFSKQPHEQAWSSAQPLVK